MRVEIDDEKQAVIGSPLLERFLLWFADNREHFEGNKSERIVNAFIEWLLRTGDGDVALKRINDFPRQLFLPFTDDDRPWRVVDEAHGDGR